MKKWYGDYLSDISSTMMTCRIKARALAESQHLMIDPSQLENLPEYPHMRGGFGTVRVVKFNDSLVAVKDLNISGNRDDRIRFTMVGRVSRCVASRSVFEPSL